MLLTMSSVSLRPLNSDILESLSAPNQPHGRGVHGTLFSSKNMLTAVVSSQGDGREPDERELGIHHGTLAKPEALIQFLRFGVLIWVRCLGCL
jgi:hypothetical protein